MNKASELPAELIDGGSMPETQGLEDGDWYYEEDQGVSRMGIRILAKLREERSPYQKICVYDTPFFGKLLTLDDVVMFTERDEFTYHEMFIHVPLCSLPAPKSALIIGGGDCGCLREALKHPGLERIVQCDIDERVTRVCEEHFDWVSECRADPRGQLLFSDGAVYLEGRPDSFDLIVVDSTDPKGPGVGLFTADFYAKARRALKAGGVLVAQTESPFWDPAMVGAIYGQLEQVFEKVRAYMGPTPHYPSGTWSWAYASRERAPEDHFDQTRAERLEADCLYYNRGIHQACFALPNFALRALKGENPFARFETRQTGK